MNQINSISKLIPQNVNRPGAQLSKEDKAKAQAILNKYDLSKLDEADQIVIRKELQAAGIRPGKDLKIILEKNGITPKDKPILGAEDDLTKSARPKAKGPRPEKIPPKGSEELESNPFMKNLKTLFEQIERNELGQDEQKTSLEKVLEQMKERNLSTTGNFVNKLV